MLTQYFDNTKATEMQRSEFMVVSEFENVAK